MVVGFGVGVGVWVGVGVGIGVGVGVGEPFKLIVDLIDTFKISTSPSCCCQPRQRREVCALNAPKAHVAAELLFGALKALGMRSMCAECAQTLNALVCLKNTN